MAKDKKKKENKEHKARERLLNAGTILFSEKGYAGTTVREIVDRAGVTKPVNLGVKENRELFNMIHNLIFGPPQGSPEYDLDRYHQAMVEAVKTIYREGLERNEVIAADPEDVAALVLGLMDFSFHLEHVFPGSRTSGRPEEILRLAFEGLKKRE